jgi:hypothetical protein
MVQPARIVLRNAQLGAGDFDSGWETGIEINAGQILRLDVRHSKRLLADFANSGRGMVVHSFGHLPQIVGVGAAVQEHPFGLRNPEFARLAHAGHQHRGRHVHFDDGAEIFRVGKADNAIFL